MLSAKNALLPELYLLLGKKRRSLFWRFLKLEGQTLSIDLNDYAVPPVEILLGMLVWMVREG
ncbi:MAG: hypothetical protein HWQ41_14970 [Nostoc sp. NOS(2021)]|uniref:hypothetical protein n=1 Tax=Nostoc sp. NOS(2021) TaxID=2815407 RepID=UPI0025D59EAD|nr:hypothetical protein [Nostoc sp. NOS(2021)]MBN3896512.1 hypothetical protein [Nostoc sp. NOS(2021)]